MATKSVDELLTDLESSRSDEDRLQIFSDMALIYDPVHDSRRFELLCTRIATRLPSLVSFCLTVAGSRAEPDRVRVFAAVTGATACRRNRRRAEGQEILRQVRDIEDSYPLLRHMLALTYRGGEPAELLRGSRLAEQAYSMLPDNPGVIHSLATFLTDIAYLDDDPSDDRQTLERAFTLVNDAIKLEPRSRFFYTRAKINRKLGNFDAAKNDLGIAIETEDWNASDHRHRIAEYIVESSLVDADRATQHYLQRTSTVLDETERRITELSDRVDHETQRTAGAQIQTITALAFFAAMLALIQFAGLTLGKGFSLGQSLILVGTLAGILLGGLIVGSWILQRTQVPRRRK